MDFTELTSTLKKTTKQATSFAMKPLKVVTNPLLEANKKLQDSIFGPDMALLMNLHTKQQHERLFAVYSNHLEDTEKKITEKNISAKKRQSYIHACQLIAASCTSKEDINVTVAAMHDLFDELRTACKQGVPTKLQETSFVVDTKTSFTESEFTHISDQVAATKSFLSTTLTTLLQDMTSLFLEPFSAGDAETLSKNLETIGKNIDSEEKAYHDHLTGFYDQAKKGKTSVRQITTTLQQIKETEKKEHTVPTPEKAHAAKTKQEHLDKLKNILQTQFIPWQDALSKAYTEIKKQSDTYISCVNALDTTWGSYANDREKRYKKTATTAEQAKKQYKKTVSGYAKKTLAVHELLGHSYEMIDKKLISPYDQISWFTTQLGNIEQQHKQLHNSYLDYAEYIWQTGTYMELPFCAQTKIIDDRVRYISDSLSFRRQHLFHAKLMKRYRTAIGRTIKDAIERIDTEKVYASALLSGPLRTLHTMYTTIQKQIVFRDKSLEAYESYINQEKQELWDSITFRRLLAVQRTWQKDMSMSVIGSTHQESLSQENKQILAQEKILNQREKEIYKKHKIDHTALEEQQKTVTLVKTKEQKEKLRLLETQVDAQEHMLQHIHTLLDTLNLHKKELSSLEKKYMTFGKQHLNHAQQQKKRISSLIKKAKKSPLNKWVHISSTLQSFI